MTLLYKLILMGFLPVNWILCCFFVGRRVAELELYIGLSQLMKNFRIGNPGKEEIDALQKILLVPEQQLNLSFTDIWLL